jgi:putative restriction endonuclease
MPRRAWTRDELIVAFNLYCKLRFGQCHGRNPHVIDLGRALARTPNAVAMKLCNFASFDPAHQSRGVTGLGNASRGDKEIWHEFNNDWNRLALASEQATRDLLGDKAIELNDEADANAGSPSTLVGIATKETETRRLQNVRLGQAFFRATVLAAYHDHCCMCRLAFKSLLIASHIVPWAIRPELRLDPRNGLCLCAMHDKAFDRGLVGIGPDWQIVVSRRLDDHLPHPVVEAMFLAFRDRPIHLPEKFRPIPDHLEYHRTNIYQAS